mmetsp:Transcript_120059/g.299486  ORF Transcript_120059/g.299486 Transcript_120059/m.299486 type:complete len:554 (+) Transcript_120059:92-1753(+)
MLALKHVSSQGSAQVSVLAAGAACLAYQLFLRWRYRPRNTNVMLGVWWLGPFANLPRFWELLSAALQKKHLDYITDGHDELGRTFAAKPPLAPWWVVTRCPKNVEHMLSTNFHNYPKGSFSLANLEELLGKGIFNVDGHEWYHQRKTASHMFTAKLFKEHIWVVVQRNAKKLCHILEATSVDKPIDVFNLMNRFTLDTIGEIGFGKCIGSLEDPSSPFLESFDRAQQISFLRFFVPIWRLLRWMGCSIERSSAEHFGRLDSYSRTVVRELRSCMAKESDPAKAGVVWADIEARKSFVGLFMQDAKKRGEECSEDFLRDLVLNFLIAGRDTTAQNLSWAIFCLCRHPEAAAKARVEVIQVCGSREITYDAINRLPYLQAVLSEALRLYPSVPLDVKTVLKDDVWPDGTQVRRGNLAVYNIYGMGRDPDIWGEDAGEFRPERWLEMDRHPDSYTYPVFNAGPRECLGKRLAQVEMKTCLAVLLPRLSFKLAVPAEEITPDGQLTIGMGRGLPCFIESVTPAKQSKLSSAASTSASSVGGDDHDLESVSSCTEHRP